MPDEIRRAPNDYTLLFEAHLPHVADNGCLSCLFYENTWCPKVTETTTHQHHNLLCLGFSRIVLQHRATGAILEDPAALVKHCSTDTE